MKVFEINIPLCFYYNNSNAFLFKVDIKNIPWQRINKESQDDIAIHFRYQLII